MQSATTEIQHFFCSLTEDSFSFSVVYHFIQSSRKVIRWNKKMPRKFIRVFFNPVVFSRWNCVNKCNPLFNSLKIYSPVNVPMKEIMAQFMRG